MEITNSQFDLGDPRHYEQFLKDHELGFVSLRVLFVFCGGFPELWKRFSCNISLFLFEVPEK